MEHSTCYAVVSGAGGADTITMNAASRVTIRVLYIYEYQGAAGLDALCYGAGTQGGATCSLTTRYANDTLFGQVWDLSTVQGPGSGFAARNTYFGNMGEDKTVTTTGTFAITVSTSNPWSIFGLAMRPVSSVTIAPTSASLVVGASQQFTATVSGTANTAVSWTATGGTVSVGGLYTAPATAGTYTVSATSTADATKSASANVTVSVPVVAVSVSPTSASVQTGGTQQFSATVSGTANTAVTWTATGGTVSASGLHTAPATAGTYTVTATSATDTTKSATASVTVTAPPRLSVSISPTSSNLVVGGTQQFTATVTNATDGSVTWSSWDGHILGLLYRSRHPGHLLCNCHQRG